MERVQKGERNLNWRDIDESLDRIITYIRRYKLWNYCIKRYEKSN